MKFQNIFTPCFCSDGKNPQNDNTGNTEIELQETGFDRVKRMYTKTDFGFVSPELFYLIKSASIAVSVSAVYGAMVHVNRARDDFFRQNVASQFESQHLARRRLADTMSLSAFKGGFKYAAKYGSFSSLYWLSTMTVANYNNKITIWEHIGSGALIGGLFRINYGLKGMAAAACVGAVLGTLSGGILVFSMWLSNTTFQELREYESMAYLESRRYKSKSNSEDLLKRD